VAQGAVIVADLVWSLVTVTADKVETLEVGPAMALETICIGVITYELHRVHAKLCLIPCVTGHVAVLARHDSGQIMRADVAGIAVAESGFQVALPVAIQTHLHGADDVSGNGIEPVSYLTVAITAQHPTCGARPNSVPDQPVRGTQIVLGELIREIAVAEQTIFRVGLAEVVNKILMCYLFIGLVSSAGMAGDTTQAAVWSLQRSRVNVVLIYIYLWFGTGLQDLFVRVAPFAFAGQGLCVVNLWEIGRGRELRSQGAAQRYGKGSHDNRYSDETKRQQDYHPFWPM
jgi:hypothetical protein